VPTSADVYGLAFFKPLSGAFSVENPNSKSFQSRCVAKVSVFLSRQVFPTILFELLGFIIRIP